MFKKHIAIDWSGANSYRRAVDIRVAIKRPDDEARIEPPLQGRPGQSGWSRASLVEWLTTELRSDRATIVALDFGFGFPWGSCDRVFHAQNWGEMIANIEILHDFFVEGLQCGRDIAEFINDAFGSLGPFWTGDMEVWRLAALLRDLHLPYYRLVEMAIPQAKSQWYAGPGATVTLQTLTGLSVLAKLVSQRGTDKGLDFQIWPHEVWRPDGRNIIAECYPALYRNNVNGNPVPPEYNNDPHAKDAWKVLQWMLGEEDADTLGERFQIGEKPFGRVSGVSFQDQVQVEGWILGVG